MAVLKRFSYDNIVEHNPTAPDPVEGGGGSGGETTPRIIAGGSISVVYSGGLTAGQTTLLLNDMDEPMENPDQSMYAGVVVLTGIEYGALKEYYNGFGIRYNDITGTPNGLSINLSGVSSDVSGILPAFRATGYVIYVYMGD